MSSVSGFVAASFQGLQMAHPPLTMARKSQVTAIVSEFVDK